MVSFLKVISIAVEFLAPLSLGLKYYSSNFSTSLVPNRGNFPHFKI